MDVIILGCGLAGLGAAHKLMHNGLKVCILEAQGKAGGRVNTIEMKAFNNIIENCKEVHKIEAGAQWLHGKDNDLFKIAEAHGLISEEIGEEAQGVFLRNDGVEFEKDLINRIDFEIGKIFEECEGLIEKPHLKEISILEKLDQRFYEFLDSSPKIDHEKAMQLYDWHKRFQIIDNSCNDLSDVSANYWGTYSFNGESCQAHINVKNGLEQLVSILLKSISKVTKVHFNTEVVEINWNKPGDYPVEISCRNGELFKTKSVIVTFSIGFLKENIKELFYPELPTDFKTAITCTGFGTINKIYLKFKNPNWDAQFKGLQILWNSENSNEYPDWMKWITGFDLMGDDTLVGWIGGQGAIDMELLNDTDIVENCVFLLRKFLNMNISYPTHFYCTRWHSNSFVRGAYSYKSCSERLKKVHLSDPITSKDSYPLILFAGEATHYSYYSTAHGAFISGQNQAKKILSFNKT